MPSPPSSRLSSPSEVYSVLGDGCGVFDTDGGKAERLGEELAPKLDDLEALPVCKCSLVIVNSGTNMAALKTQSLFAANPGYVLAQNLPRLSITEDWVVTCLLCTSLISSSITHKPSFLAVISFIGNQVRLRDLYNS